MARPERCDGVGGEASDRPSMARPERCEELAGKPPIGREGSSMQAPDTPAPAAREALRRALSTAFSARDLAEPLVPLEASMPAALARAVLEERRCAVAGVTSTGRWQGWLQVEDLVEGETCGEACRPFDERPILGEAAPLREVLLALGRSEPLFVSLLGQAAAVITRADLQKAPMRMWLFGTLTLAETLMTRMIERQLPGEAWFDYLSPGRVDHARALQEERRRRRQEAPLHECLQFGDKADILLKFEPAREQLGIESRRRGQELFRRMEGLRNCLAHAQPLPVEDLEVLVVLAEVVDDLVEFAARPPLALAD